VNDFSDVLFPGDLRNCAKCHVNGYQEVPVPSTRSTCRLREDSTIPWDRPPRLHGLPYRPGCAAHTSIMTDPKLGESCSVCHSSGAAFSVDEVHARSL